MHEGFIVRAAIGTRWTGEDRSLRLFFLLRGSCMSRLRNILAAAGLAASVAAGLSVTAITAVNAAESSAGKISKNVAVPLKAAQDATKKQQWNVALDELKKAQ